MVRERLASLGACVLGLRICVSLLLAITYCSVSLAAESHNGALVLLQPSITNVAGQARIMSTPIVFPFLQTASVSQAAIARDKTTLASSTSASVTSSALAHKAKPQAATTEKETVPLSSDELNRQALESVAPNCIGLNGKSLQSCIDKALKGTSSNTTPKRVVKPSTTQAAAS